jgi:hypothetical protein
LQLNQTSQPFYNDGGVIKTSNCCAARIKNLYVEKKNKKCPPPLHSWTEGGTQGPETNIHRENPVESAAKNKVSVQKSKNTATPMLGFTEKLGEAITFFF